MLHPSASFQRLNVVGNQVTPFNFTTPDQETIYAWHVLPLGLYAKHKSELLKDPSGCAEDITKTAGYALLKNSPDSRLVINCQLFSWTFSIS